MEVIKVTPRGYCYGVVDAILMARKVASDPSVPKPVYILGLIVHNRHVVQKLQREYGIISLDGTDRLALLEQIPAGATIIFTAHGVSPAVKEAALAKGCTCYDATCADVTRTHELVRNLTAQGYHIIYVGHHGHPESDGVVGVASTAVHIVETKDDVDALNLPAVPLAITTQTTMSQWDTADLIEYILQHYPQAKVYNEICMATQQRQEAVVEAAAKVDAVVVVGDRRSNNSNRLVQVVRERTGKPAYLVDTTDDIRPEWFIGCYSVAVTSGSSTPTGLTRSVISYLETLVPQQNQGDSDVTKG